jgi:nondiscriminating glutamyl-tRNA synthetase
MGDFVIVRSDGVPTYNFAVVVDDAEMAITHVIRGAGHLSNTPHQLLVYRALGLEPPVFAHAPTVLGDDRTKLSKRSGARPLQALAEEGLHPDAVVNYLSLLGWSSPSGDEVLSRDRLVRRSPSTGSTPATWSSIRTRCAGSPGSTSPG